MGVPAVSSGCKALAWMQNLRENPIVPQNPQGMTLQKPPDLDPFFDDLTRAKSAKELNEHLEMRVL